LQLLSDKTLNCHPDTCPQRKALDKQLDEF